MELFHCTLKSTDFLAFFWPLLALRFLSVPFSFSHLSGNHLHIPALLLKPSPWSPTHSVTATKIMVLSLLKNPERTKSCYIYSSTSNIKISPFPPLIARIREFIGQHYFIKQSRMLLRVQSYSMFAS